MAGFIVPVSGSTGTTWTSAGFTATDFNSLANGSFVLAATAIAQSTNLDDWLNVSYSLTVGGTTTAAGFLSLYWMPLAFDGSTYGDGTPTGTVAPAASYWMCNSFPKVGVLSGSAIVGRFPPLFVGAEISNGKFGIVNNLGVALNAAAAATVDYLAVRTNGNG